jgi:hypothetical protein
VNEQIEKYKRKPSENFQEAFLPYHLFAQKSRPHEVVLSPCPMH